MGRRVGKGRPDVIPLEVWELPDDFLRRHPVGEHFQDVLDTNSQASNARSAAEFSIFQRNAIQKVDHRRNIRRQTWGA